MRKLGLAVVALVLMAGIALAEDNAVQPESTAASLDSTDVQAAPAEESMAPFFPKPQEVSGWATSADVQTYPGKKIYDFIDGAGEVYMTYNFTVAASAEYSEPKGGVVAIDIYRMKTPEDAYGIYSYNRGAKYDKLDVSQAGYVSGIMGGLWKDVYYVKVYAQEDKPGVADAVKQFVTLMSGKIPGEGMLPDLFRSLNVEGFNKGTERFLRSQLALKNMHFVSEDNVLNLDETTQMVFGDYSLKGRDFSAFIVLYPSEQAATAAASKYATYIGAHPEAEATWFKQLGKTVVGAWTGLKVSETNDSQDMIYGTVQNLIGRIKIYGFEK
jgi:hypothetical protein